jgi:sugar lactone lactonase YvrE
MTLCLVLSATALVAADAGSAVGETRASRIPRSASVALAIPQSHELGFLSRWAATPEPHGGGQRLDVDAQGLVYVTSETGSSSTGSVIVHKASGEVERVFQFKEPNPTDPNRLTDVYASFVAPDGSLWVIGGQNYALHHFASDGTFIKRFAVRTGFQPDLVYANDIAFGADGTLFVLDMKGRRVVHFSDSGSVLSSWGSLGDGPGEFGADTPVSTPIGGPEGIATDGKGAVYVADTANSRIEKFSENGIFIRSFAARGPGGLTEPTQIAIGRDGSLYVISRDSALSVYSPDGKLLWYMGGLNTSYDQAFARLSAPSDIAVAPDGRVLIANGECTDKPSRCGYIDVFGPGGIVPAGSMPPRVAAAKVTLAVGARLGDKCPPIAVGLPTCTGLAVATVRWSIACEGNGARPGWAIALRTLGSEAGRAGSYRPPGFSGPVFEPAPPHDFHGTWLFADGEDLGSKDPRKSNVVAYASGASHTSGSRQVLIRRGLRLFPAALFVCRRHVGFDTSRWGDRPAWDPRMAEFRATWQEATLATQGAARKAG